MLLEEFGSVAHTEVFSVLPMRPSAPAGGGSQHKLPGSPMPHLPAKQGYLAAQGHLKSTKHLCLGKRMKSKVCVSL